MPYLLSSAQIQERLDRSPFNHWLQLRVVSLDDEGIKLTLTSRPELVGNVATGAMHGGILASLVDVAGSMSIIARTGKRLVTVDLRTDFHRPALDAELFVTGAVVKLGKQLATSDVRILDTQQRLVASGRIVAMHMELVGSSAATAAGIGRAD